MKPIPSNLLGRPFSRSEARDAGLTDRMLDGGRFVRVMPGVHRHRDHVMTPDDWVAAAQLALPAHARMTGITRLQQLGLDYGPRLPVRFVVEGDLHLAFPGVFLHRTKQLPPTDDVGVTPSAAYISYCRRARVIDAIKVGDWLLHRGHMSAGGLHDLALAQEWRDGAHEALWVLDHLNADSRSLPESEVRALLQFAGLAVPESNRTLGIEDDVLLIGDLVYRQWRTIVEYEGRHHQEKRAQYLSDLDRYAILRHHDLAYVQVTNEKLAHPRILVGEVYRELVRHGYDGAPPRFDGDWLMLFARITDLLGPRHEIRRRGGSSTVS